MIANKRVRVAEELWRDFPELRWKTSMSRGDIAGRISNGRLRIWFGFEDKMWHVWGSGTWGTLRDAIRRYGETND